MYPLLRLQTAFLMPWHLAPGPHGAARGAACHHMRAWRRVSDTEGTEGRRGEQNTGRRRRREEERRRGGEERRRE